MGILPQAPFSLLAGGQEATSPQCIFKAEIGGRGNRDPQGRFARNRFGDRILGLELRAFFFLDN